MAEHLCFKTTYYTDMDLDAIASLDLGMSVSKKERKKVSKNH